MSTSYQTLVAGLAELGLKAMHDGVGDVIDDVNSGRMSFTEGMNELVSRELARSRKRRTESIVAVAHFPSVKTFEQYAEFQSPCQKRKNHLTTEACSATMVK